MEEKDWRGEEGEESARSRRGGLESKVRAFEEFDLDIDLGFGFGFGL
jgi:hypothetical protein